MLYSCWAGHSDPGERFRTASAHLFPFPPFLLQSSLSMRAQRCRLNLQRDLWPTVKGTSWNESLQQCRVRSYNSVSFSNKWQTKPMKIKRRWKKRWVLHWLPKWFYCWDKNIYFSDKLAVLKASEWSIASFPPYMTHRADTTILYSFIPLEGKLFFYWSGTALSWRMGQGECVYLIYLHLNPSSVTIALSFLIVRAQQT